MMLKNESHRLISNGHIIIIFFSNNNSRQTISYHNKFLIKNLLILGGAPGRGGGVPRGGAPGRGGGVPRGGAPGRGASKVLKGFRIYIGMPESERNWSYNA